MKNASFETPRFSSYAPSEVSLHRQQTSAEAWRKRQQVNPKRMKTVKVKLSSHGTYVTEHAVPTPIRNVNMGTSYGSQSYGTEFTHMRYTAATCDPDDFSPDIGYTLRQKAFNRKTDLLIAITYYNEDKVLVARTLHGVMLNIRDIVKSRWSEFRKMAEKDDGEAGEGQAWKRIVVCFVFDGIEPANTTALDLLATIGLYQDGVLRGMVDDKETVAHLFEYTTQLSVSPKPELIQPQAGDPNNLCPVQLILCLKQKNTKKINSHRWLFNAVGRQLDPEVCILIDAGTKPGGRSLYYLWEAMYHNKNLGGACGEITAQLDKGKKLLNPLVAAQNFEYKMSNILDKPTEHSFGYVSVLPGAFSAYRYRAIQGRPLEQYFHGDHTLAARLGKKGVLGMGIFKKNMFLAEDRILCFELVAKANERWVLGYVKPSKAETDVPEAAAELIGQRRRWLNGSFAASIYSLVRFPRLYKSGHGITRMIFFHVQAIYNLVTLIMSWFAIGNFWLTFSIIIEIVAQNLWKPDDIQGEQATINCWKGSFLEGEKHCWLCNVNWGLEVLYLSTVSLQVILALGNRPKGERFVYATCFWIFAGLSLYLIANTILLTVKAFCPIGTLLDQNNGSVVNVYLGSTYGPIFAGLLGTFGVYIISSFLALDPWHIFTSLPPYLLIAPSFTNILNVYAFCNLHDVSWGTKGSDKADALPSVTTKKDKKEGGEMVVEDVAKNQEDIDNAFKATVLRAIAPFKEEETIEEPNIDDQNKTFRTRLISVWLFTNTILGVVIGRLGKGSQTIYFQAILWITFGLSAVRFLGFLWYLCGETLFRIGRLCARGRK
ncbi:glycosyltransferase family 2 protein [Atractiella rhizophila]|nr:glycosyltransferase family 2 protein [Atractiella rhizophila]